MNSTIIFGDVRKNVSDYISKLSFSKIVILVDENTEKHCLSKVTKSLNDFDIIQIKSGEENKSLTTCNHIWQSLTDLKHDRQCVFINLGGGVIGDMGGFCAATYKRGLTFINIPTTLLAMVDASVGGKLGIDFGSYKNHIGLFQEPDHVFIDPSFLSTLPERELRSGFAEVIKHALITKSSDWDMLNTSDFKQLDWWAIIEKSVTIKTKIVGIDFKESGLRKTLNFGHTIGHAVESFFLEQQPHQHLLHGEAVAIGMICETYLSKEKLRLSEKEFSDIVKYISKMYETIDIPEQALNNIVELCKHDKKNAGNKIQAVLLKSIGTPIINSEISSEDILNALRYYSTLNI